MNARPTSITVVSVILIVFSAFSFLSACMNFVFLNFPQFTDPQIQKAVEEAMAANPFPPAVQVGMPLVGGLVMLIAGIAMLRGRGWGRWLFTVYFVLGLGIALAISHMKLLLIPGAMPQILLIYFMFRPVANAYFSPSEVVSSA